MHVGRPASHVSRRREAGQMGTSFLVLASFVPYRAGQVEPDPGASQKLYLNMMTANAYNQAHHHWSGKKVWARTTTTFDLDGLTNTRSALKLLCQTDVGRGFSLKTRKSHYIFQTVVGETLKNLDRTVASVVSAGRAASVLDIRDRQCVKPSSRKKPTKAQEFGNLLDHMSRCYQSAVQSKCSDILRRLTSVAGYVVSNSEGAKEGLGVSLHTYGTHANVTNPVKLPKSISKIDHKNLDRSLPRLFSGAARAEGADFLSVRSLLSRLLVRKNWCNDLFTPLEEKMDTEFVEGMQAMIKDIDLLNKLVEKDISTDKFSAGAPNSNRSMESMWSGLNTRDNIRNTELAKAYSLKEDHESGKSDKTIMDSWIHLCLDPEKAMPKFLPDGSPVINEQTRLGELRRFQTQIASLEKLLGMEATSIMAYVNLEAHLAVLTNPSKFGSMLSNALRARGLSKTGGNPNAATNSAFKYFTDTVLTSFCKGLGPDYAKVLLDEIDHLSNVDVDVLRQCYSAPDLWRKNRDYSYKTADKDSEMVFTDRDIEIEPLWKYMKSPQRAAMKKLSDKSRYVLAQRDVGLEE